MQLTAQHIWACHATWSVTSCHCAQCGTWGIREVPTLSAVCTGAASKRGQMERARTTSWTNQMPLTCQKCNFYIYIFTYTYLHIHIYIYTVCVSRSVIGFTTSNPLMCSIYYYMFLVDIGYWIHQFVLSHFGVVTHFVSGSVVFLSIRHATMSWHHCKPTWSDMFFWYGYVQPFVSEQVIYHSISLFICMIILS